MARYKRMKSADVAAGQRFDDIVAEPELDEASALVMRAAVTPLPEPGPDRLERIRVLTARTIRHEDPQVAKDAVVEAAKVRCMTEFTCASTDEKACAELARFFGWAAVGGVVDAKRLLRRSVVEEYLTRQGHRRPRGLRECRHVLHTAGRLFHPREYPPARVLPAPRPKRQTAASHDDIRKLYRLIRELPRALGTRAQALADLSYGVGARPKDLKLLRGSAITTVRSYGRAFCVVTLPNSAGGVRQVPVMDSGINARLLGLAARAGDGLVLAPDKEFAERNIVNRISEHLRRRGYPSVQPAALRNRWVLDLAERVPAALLLQLADVHDLRVLADQRGQLPHYKVRHAITILQEGLR
jgi:hypothetical protein